MSKYDRLDEIQLNKEDEVGRLEVPEKVDTDARDEQGRLLRRMDPRPDIEKDHDLWVMVLANAGMILGFDMVYGVLHWFRCSGAGLQRVPGKLGFKLVAGSWDREGAGMDWDEAKRLNLEPIKEKLAELFAITHEHGEIPAVFEGKPVREKGSQGVLFGE